jgi:transposase
MPDLTEAECNQIIGLFKGGSTKANIIKTLGFSKTTVYRTIKLYHEGKSLKTQPRSGRPKLLNNEHQKTLKKIVKKNNHQSAEQIKNKFQEKTEMQVST